ncbi:aldehyde dehydrogenase (NAD+) [Paraburkholderia atlantica]|uniref:aldehyde dehydrogenase (NAD(+)) n=2 Tax=Paraburkholderia TaxID=1822464 RepID=A0A7W8P6W5_9BURK|nr:MULTISPECIES: aldehyde dehydrogenase family protein [Paraburkholderia]MBB5405841.1 aldehyde dehydrogenase (NAD+) [Paraburkholderia youngii]MBB5421404.1 aldehyde dehydrogenase (NAD+) [Paraburkholderia atlantica]MBB5429466.1 aldehyde dehydrogenase (NAD+) [Paraburkholderia atlantica]MPW11555.1 aldehyde dehydrogenase family protein [Paraburkholderia atlantica]NUY35823.1 aldehyde dehydrogenase family protein [Paraburkholderia atlantica]
MSNAQKFYIDGVWVTPLGDARLAVVDPCTEEAFAQIALGNADDVERAVTAAKRAFASFSLTPLTERVALIRSILDAYAARYDEMADVISREIGAPKTLSHTWQAALGRRHLEELLRTCERFAWQRKKGTTLVNYEPVGVAALITPWNWPINQIVCKVAPAIAAGCTMVLKPSEISPLNAVLFAEILDAAGVPPGVFNLVNGDGPTVGAALCSHPDVDMVSFTGSTRAGVEIAKLAAPTVKRVHQELGGKSANILLDDVDLESAVTSGVYECFGNSGQSCNAPTRMLVPAALHDEAVRIAQHAAASHCVGPANDDRTTMGPLVSDVQYTRVQRLIKKGIEEGALLAAGGPGRPDGLSRGYYARPTVFANVDQSMTIAREEIFGPVLAIMPYRDEEDAIAIANDTPFGLAAYVQSADRARAQRVALRLRAGSVYLNYPAWDAGSPFGGYKQSGNGREYGEWGLEAFLEVKAIVGYDDQAGPGTGGDVHAYSSEDSLASEYPRRWLNAPKP